MSSSNRYHFTLAGMMSKEVIFIYIKRQKCKEQIEATSLRGLQQDGIPRDRNIRAR